MGELPHAASCVFIFHKDSIADGQVPEVATTSDALASRGGTLSTNATRICWPSVVHVSSACVYICLLARRFQEVLAVL